MCLQEGTNHAELIPVHEDEEGEGLQVSSVLTAPPHPQICAPSILFLSPSTALPASPPPKPISGRLFMPPSPSCPLPSSLTDQGPPPTGLQLTDSSLPSSLPLTGVAWNQPVVGEFTPRKLAKPNPRVCFLFRELAYQHPLTLQHDHLNSSCHHLSRGPPC